MPVLIGHSVPCRDPAVVSEKYAAAMLTLFKTWPTSGTASNLLFGHNPREQFQQFKLEAPPSVLDLFDKFQELHECVDAKDDMGSRRREILASLGMNAQMRVNDSEGRYDHDPNWQEAMMDTEGDETDEELDEMDMSSRRRQIRLLAAAEILHNSGVLSVKHTTTAIGGTIVEGGDQEYHMAKMATIQLQEQRTTAHLPNDSTDASTPTNTRDQLLHRHFLSLPNPVLTTMEERVTRSLPVYVT